MISCSVCSLPGVYIYYFVIITLKMTSDILIYINYISFVPRFSFLQRSSYPTVLQYRPWAAAYSKLGAIFPASDQFHDKRARHSPRMPSTECSAIPSGLSVIPLPSSTPITTLLHISPARAYRAFKSPNLEVTRLGTLLCFSATISSVR